MKKMASLVLGLCSAAFALIGVFAAVSSVGASEPTPPGSATISAAEREARAMMARQQLMDIQKTVTFKARFPSSVPAGYAYDRVIWDSGKSNSGFEVHLVGTNSTVPDAKFIEAPAVTGAYEDTLTLPGLVPVALSSGSWMAYQKPENPWKGMWILTTIQDGVHMEVDGPRDIAMAIAGQM